MFFSDFNINEMYLAVADSFAGYDNAIMQTLRFSEHEFMLLSCVAYKYDSHHGQGDLTCRGHYQRSLFCRCFFGEHRNCQKG